MNKKTINFQFYEVANFLMILMKSDIAQSFYDQNDQQQKKKRYCHIVGPCLFNKKKINATKDTAMCLYTSICLQILDA